MESFFHDNLLQGFPPFQGPKFLSRLKNLLTTAGLSTSLKEHLCEADTYCSHMSILLLWDAKITFVCTIKALFFIWTNPADV